MTSHALARVLLKQPDKLVMYQEDLLLYTKHSWVEVIAVHYDERQQKVLLV